ncbi:MAG TPA: DUF5723 family protein [Chitinophaga sp.]|uniref:DUF5723 family protein n=1 Tax=Chitinophaga sp. TaxID=1869181 RepID=UPI002C9792E0|nr:DUF5723 family protein [Chitinophaga sp.]HVI49375.1 DUF5723 family protein [Chitinophaga sp.]
MIVTINRIFNNAMRLSLPLLLLSHAASAQTFPGYHTSNYAGIHGVISNPATAAGYRYKWDVNIIGADVKAGNTYARFPKSLLFNIPDTFKRNRDYFLDTAAQRQQNGWGMAEIVMPSILYAIDEKQSVSFIWRLRSSGNGGNVPTPIANFFGDNYPNVSYTGKGLNVEHTAVTAHMWNEFGLSYARVLKNGYDGRLKGGITVKILGGIAAGYAAVTDAGFVLNTKRNATITSGMLRYGYSEQLDDWQKPPVRNVKFFNNLGVGVDIGFIYEYRPDNGGFGPYETSDADDYKFRIGVSVTDIGKIRYTKGKNNRDLDLRKDNVDPNAITYKKNESLQQYARRLNNYFTPVDSSEEFVMTLPAALNLMGDYNIDNRFFVSASAVIALTAGKQSITKTYALTQLLITPRYETEMFGAYLPLVINHNGQADAGVGVRYGPLVLGSYSILSDLFQRRVNHADAFVALRLNPGMFKRKSSKGIGCPVNNQ